jgi:aldehyde dehydrogenase (NAD+)
MGAYHGEWGFREFTHPQTVLFGQTVLNLPLREHPYGGAFGRFKYKVIRLLER